MKQKKEMKALGLTALFFFITFLGSLPCEVWAHSSGVSGYSGKSGSICTKCHSDGMAPTVTLTGPTSLVTGESAVFTLTSTGGAAVVGGLDVSTTAGTLKATDSNTQLVKGSGEITHTSAVPFSNGSLSFTFTLTAPSTAGSLTLFASGFSGDGDGGTSGDNAAGTTLTVNVGTPHIVVTDSVAPVDDHIITYGYVTIGQTQDQTVTITNQGSAILNIGTIAGTDHLASPFSIQSDTCSGKTLAPAVHCTATVRFAPTSLGSASDSFDVPSNDASSPSVTVSVSGTGTATSVPHIEVTDSVAPVDDHIITYGYVAVGQTQDQTVTITNQGSAILNIGTIAGTDHLASPFSIQSDTCSGKTLAPAAHCTATVRFAPTSLGSASDSFDVPSNDASTPSVTVSVSGSGIAASAPHIVVIDSVASADDHSMTYGSVTVGQTQDQTVTIANEGSDILNIGTIAGTDHLASPFSIPSGSDTCSGKTLAPAEHCTVTVRFAPAGEGSVSDSLDVPSNDSSAPSITVSVSGTGINPPSVPTLVSPADGQTDVETTVTLEWNKSTDPDNDTITYHLYYCADGTFASCTPVDVASNGKAGIYLAGSGFLFFGFIFFSGSPGCWRFKMLILAMLLMIGSIFSSCGGGGGGGSGTRGGNGTITSTVATQQISGLSGGATYFWKVVADDGKGGLAESAVWSFSTQ